MTSILMRIPGHRTHIGELSAENSRKLKLITIVLRQIPWAFAGDVQRDNSSVSPPQRIPSVSENDSESSFSI